MALDLLHLSGKFRIRHLQNIPLMLRIGMHTGKAFHIELFKELEKKYFDFVY